MNRILDLPRLAPGAVREIPEWVYTKNTRPGTDWRLRHMQALALYEFHKAQGMLGNLPVGEGKTLLTGLLPNMVKLPAGRDAHLFVPATKVDKTYEELAELDQHFNISRRLWVHSYGSLSNVRSGPDLIDRLNPGMLIFDEVHKLANVDSVSWLRVMRWLEQFPDTYFAGFSGTLMKTKIEDYAHLLAAALRGNSPIPMEWDALQPWSSTVGEDTAMSFARNADWEAMQPLIDAFADDAVPVLSLKRADRKTLVRQAVLNRLDTCRGVVLSKVQSTDVPLSIELLEIPIPDAVQDSIEDLLEDWVRPDGECLDSGLQVTSVGLQLSQGFHYYWDWPGEPDEEWLGARNAFNKAIGKICKKKKRGMDSPGQVYKKIRQTGALLAFVREVEQNGLSPVTAAGILLAEIPTQFGILDPEMWDALDDWLDERHKPKPPTATEWIDYFVVQDVMKRLDATEEPTLVWYGHTAVADALSVSGLEVCRPKEDPDATRPRHLGVSIGSHNTGLNLQSWRRNIVVCPPSSAVAWEQMIGRTHRQGQTEAVEFQAYAYTEFMKNAVVKARRRANSIWQMKGLKQKLCSATWKGLDLSNRLT